MYASQQLASMGDVVFGEEPTDDVHCSNCEEASERSKEVEVERVVTRAASMTCRSSWPMPMSAIIVGVLNKLLLSGRTLRRLVPSFVTCLLHCLPFVGKI